MVGLCPSILYCVDCVQLIDETELILSILYNNYTSNIITEQGRFLLSRVMIDSSRVTPHQRPPYASIRQDSQVRVLSFAHPRHDVTAR